MSSDPTDLDTPIRNPRDVLHVSKSSDSSSKVKQVRQEDADIRSEKPQPKPEDDGKDSAKRSQSDTAGKDGPKGIKGAFRKHPIAMVVCLGLIVVGIIAGVAWYLHARHYESTDDAFIDGRPVLVSP
jgi:membrane fusion protein, multidrug efflux system